MNASMCMLTGGAGDSLPGRAAGGGVTEAWCVRGAALHAAGRTH